MNQIYIYDLAGFFLSIYLLALMRCISRNALLDAQRPMPFQLTRDMTSFSRHTVKMLTSYYTFSRNFPSLKRRKCLSW